MNKSDYQWDTLWVNAAVMTCQTGATIIPSAAVAVKDKKIAWVGKLLDLKEDPTKLAAIVYDVAGHLLTPGFIDCHTHVVYAGERALEFEKRLYGQTYEEITKAGGGIHSTVLATRHASKEQLYEESFTRVVSLLASGVTSIEIKSGYGLDWDTELKILRVAKQLEQNLPVTVYRTFLGAHTLPREFANNADAYIDLVCEKMLPLVAKEHLAESVDVFCEKIAFNLTQTEKIFKVATHYGLGIRCHAEQLSYSGAASLAARYKALAVDHLEYITEEAIMDLANAGTVAVLLPGAFYYLHEKKLPPVDVFRRLRVPMAIASDCNPGTSPILSLLLIMNMACNLFHFTIEEAFLGVTLHAAKALGIEKNSGSLTVGKVADFIVWNAKQPVELIYYIGNQPLKKIIKNGSEAILSAYLNKDHNKNIQ